jgi:hypothetical protein
MLPLIKTVCTGSAANAAQASPEKAKADRVFIAVRLSRFHAAASSVQRFNVNRVKTKFFSFAYWNLFRMKEMVFRAATTNGKTIFFCQADLDL